MGWRAVYGRLWVPRGRSWREQAVTGRSRQELIDAGAVSSRRQATSTLKSPGQAVGVALPDGAEAPGSVSAVDLEQTSAVSTVAAGWNTYSVACGVPEVGPGSLTSGDRWSDMIPACRCGCCT